MPSFFLYAYFRYNGSRREWNMKDLPLSRLLKKIQTFNEKSR